MKRYFKLTTSIIIFTIIFFVLSPVHAQNSGKIRINNVLVNDFTQNPISKDSYGNLTLIDQANFQVAYLPNESKFLVMITGGDFEQTRRQSESQLLSFLEISETNGCSLNIVIVGSKDFGVDVTTKAFRPTFCGGQFETIKGMESIKSPDVNGDGAVNAVDYALCIRQYGQRTGTLSCDLDSSQKIDALDLSRVLANLGT